MKEDLLPQARRASAQHRCYLDDPDEYRAITRNLLHLGGRIAYGRRSVAVSLDRPDSPRVARALGQLVDEINAGPPSPRRRPPPDRLRSRGVSVLISFVVPTSGGLVPTSSPLPEALGRCS